MNTRKMRIVVNALSISLLATLALTLAGCGDKTAGSKTEAAAAAANEKELTPEEKFSEAKRKAEAGDAEAQFNLALMYHVGSGVIKDAAKEVEWLQKAAAQGQVDAQFGLGVTYDNGDGVPKDSAKAVEWWRKAAELGNAEAQYKLGEIYEGLFSDVLYGVAKDADQAVSWYRKAAEQGHATAQFNLGVRYENGVGVPKDSVKAMEWWQKAAAQGDVDAQFNLGVMYSNGDGVPKDAAKAVEWYQKAAALGNMNAQGNLGYAYRVGNGVSRNLVLAYAWSNLSAAQGNDTGKSNRDIYEAQLTPAQRAEGQRLASNWKKGDVLQAAGDNSSGSTSPNGKPSKQGTGTAFAVSVKGHALTNHHVINGCTEVKVAGREGVAKVITTDSVNDLALLQLPGKTQDIAYFNPAPGKLRQGEDVIVFGYPLNSVLSSGGNLTPGTISALTGLGNNTNQTQITAAIQPGSSGSPVMDKKGNVVGVVSMKLSDSAMVKATGQIGQSVNFAVNGQTVKAFLDANKVPYKTGGGFFSREKSNADIAEEASKWTVLVECWK